MGIQALNLVLEFYISKGLFLFVVLECFVSKLDIQVLNLVSQGQTNAYDL
jgi:hypothetical protein